MGAIGGFESTVSSVCLNSSLDIDGPARGRDGYGSVCDSAVFLKCIRGRADRAGLYADAGDASFNSWPSAHVAASTLGDRMSKPNYCIPQPLRIRHIEKSFAWIDHRLLRNGFLPVMTHQEQSLYLFLALAADRNGVSFYRKEKVCDLLGMDFVAFEIARDRLIDLKLLAFEPYSAITVNGFYQVLPVDIQAPDFTAMLPVAMPPAPEPAAPITSPVPAAAAASKPATVADLTAQLANAFKTV